MSHTDVNAAETCLLDAESDYSPPRPAPTNREELARWARDLLNLNIPGRAVCPGHQAPLDYLAASFLPPAPGQLSGQDMLVWANRGGGKTMLAAVASLLDGLYRSPVKIRILGGSFDQSDRLADYLRNFLSDGPLAEAVVGRMTRDRIRLAGGGDIRMLAQSQRAVRGQHVQKVRCDEVDLFDPDVWRAVQFTTHSAGRSRGSLEVFSTLHRSGGLMDHLVEQARAAGGTACSSNSELALPNAEGTLLDKQTMPPGGFRLLHWCLWEIIEKCPPERSCGQCPLNDDCRGKARQAEGYFSIEDAIAYKTRASQAGWQSEMLCLGARRECVVFPEFNPAVHVGDVNYCPSWPLYRGIDMGFVNPSVCLWIQLSPEGMVHVVQELMRVQTSVELFADAVKKADPPKARVEVAYIDPSASARESTGRAATDAFAAKGIICAHRPSSIVEGLELIRAALAPAMGSPRLKISGRCRGLIRAFENYHYAQPSGGAFDENPVKDGPDHYIDALRYFFVNHMRPAGQAQPGSY